jgi:hypothetical protein
MSWTEAGSLLGEDPVMNIDAGRRAYAELSEYAAIRTKQLLPMLEPFYPNHRPLR